MTDPKVTEEQVEATRAPAVDVAAMQALIDQWEHRARCKFQCAEVQKDEAARVFIEHGAMCYFNSAQDLRAALASALPTSPERDGSELLSLVQQLSVDMAKVLQNTSARAVMCVTSDA